MKIFERDRKINFVDDNNVFVGFSYDQCCCENFGYFITEKRGPYRDHVQDIDENVTAEQLDNYEFDTRFFEEDWCPGSDCGGSVSFKLLPKKGTDLKRLYLTLYNHHNGYYSHGFEATVKDVAWQGGSI